MDSEETMSVNVDEDQTDQFFSGKDDQVHNENKELGSVDVTSVSNSPSITVMVDVNVNEDFINDYDQIGENLLSAEEPKKKVLIVGHPEFKVISISDILVKLKWSERFEQPSNKDIRNARKVLKDNFLNPHRGKLVVDYKVDNLHNTDIPTDVIMLLGEDQILNDFRDLILKHFEGKNLCVESSSYTSQGRPIIKLTIKFYSRLKKVMVQGTTESLCEWIDIYEKELAGSLKSTKQESQVPLHSDNYEISMLSEEVQNQALSTPSKQSNTSVPTNMDTPLSHRSPRVSSVISDMKLSKVEEDVIIFKKHVERNFF